MVKTEEYEGKNYLMVDRNILDKVLDKVKKIPDVETFDDNKILIDTDEKLPDDITLKINETLIKY